MPRDLTPSLLSDEGRGPFPDLLDPRTIEPDLIDLIGIE
jgi:hypothetical protein